MSKLSTAALFVVMLSTMIWDAVLPFPGQSLGQTPRASTSGAIVGELDKRRDMGRDTSLYRGRLGPPGGTARVTDIGINLPVRAGYWGDCLPRGVQQWSLQAASTQGLSGLREAPWKREGAVLLPAMDSAPFAEAGLGNRTDPGIGRDKVTQATQVATGVLPSVGEPPPSLPEQQQEHPEGAERGEGDGMVGMGDGSPGGGHVLAGVQALGGVDRLAVWQVSERSGYATYLHPSLAGGLMRDGVTRYDPEAIGPVAATSWPLGTELYICGPTGRCLTGIVSDTGKLGPFQLDISEGMFKVLGGSLDRGVIAVEIVRK